MHTLEIPIEPLPLRIDDTGTVRVGGTRVTLDTVVDAFLDGATAEEIALRYPTLNLADVYSVIGFYLRHHEAVDAYLNERCQAADEIRREMERRFDPQGIRDRLLARRSSSGKS